MALKHHSIAWSSMLLVLSLLFGSNATAANIPYSSMASNPGLSEIMRSIPENGRFILRSLNLEGMSKSQNLSLKRFRVFADDVQGYRGNERIDIRPDNRYFNGSIEGVPGSMVVLTQYADGRMKGFVFSGGGIWLLKKSTGKPLTSRSISTDELEALRPDVNGLNLDDEVVVPDTQATSAQNAPVAEALPAYSYTARVAVETDYEYYTLFNNENAALSYLGDLYAYASTIYQTEADTRLMITWYRIWPTNTDPWGTVTGTCGSSTDYLEQLADHWTNNFANVDRTLVHMLSGRNLGGGCAYRGDAVLCNNAAAYGVSADINGGFDINNPASVWDIIVVSHEMGHNFSSRHTHDYCNIGGNANPVDRCYSGCAGGSTGLPGVNSLSGGSSGQGNGTIMSYCHLQSGGYSNITLTFGRPNGPGSEHPYGIAPGRVSDQIRGNVASRASAVPGCLTPYYLLSVTPPVNGGVSSSVGGVGDGGINCGADCEQDYVLNTQVTLTATPNAGYELAGWSGDCTGTAACVVTMSESRTVTATFQLATTPSYELTVSVTGNGSVSSNPPGISCGADCSETYTENTSVSLTATPDAGESFVQWGGDCSGSGACQVTMDAAKNVTAEFTVHHDLAITFAGSGGGAVSGNGINCTSNCNNSLLQGTAVDLSALADAGSTFTGWTGEGCSGTGNCAFTLNADASVSATFAANYNLSVTVTGDGSVSNGGNGIACPGDCNEVFVDGSTTTLNATPGAGYVFSGWSGDCSGTGSCALTMSANRSVTATFVPEYQLSVNLSGNGSVSSNPPGISCGADCTENYPANTQVTLTAVADAGNQFSGWSGVAGCAGVAPCVVTMNAAQTVTAQFLPQFTLSVTRSGSGSGTVSSNPAGIDCGADCTQNYVQGESVTLSAVADAGAEFIGWSGAGCSGIADCTVTLDAAKTVNAEFGALYTLTVSTAGNGSIRSDAGGIDCGINCSAVYSQGETVTLTPIPDAGWAQLNWGGACAGTAVGDDCILTMNSDHSASAGFSLPFTLDVDDNGQYGALTDGLLVIRYLFGFTDAALIDSAVAIDCNRCTADTIAAYLDQARQVGYLDVDGSDLADPVAGSDALTDGLLVIRYLFGFSGAALIDNAVAGSCTRCSAVDIETYLGTLTP